MFVICPTTITVSGTTAVYVPVPKGCRVVGASYVVTTGVTVAADTLTISDGTNTAGTVKLFIANNLPAASPAGFGDVVIKHPYIVPSPSSDTSNSTSG